MSKKPGPKPRVWTEQERAIVKRAAIMGMPQVAISKLLKTTKTTLEANFREELDHASDQANMAVLGALYKNAIEGNVSAQIFWCKTRLGMRESSSVELSGSDGGPAILQIVSKESKDK
jgi:hypothetical protein